MNYDILYSARKTLCVQITEKAELLVRAPIGCPKKIIEEFVAAKEPWIQKKIAGRRGELKKEAAPPYSPEEKQRLIEQAGKKIGEKVRVYSKIMGVTCTRITIREQKTRWGSCSAKGSLNFNWRLILAPEKVLEYVVVHELAHRREMNHSPGFYRVVEDAMPDYRIYQRWLKEHGRELWERA